MLDTVEALANFRTQAQKAQACQEALDYLDWCLADQLTLADAAEQAVPRVGEAGSEFHFWVRTEMAEVISPEFRYLLTDLMSRDNPRMAAHIDLYFADLSADEAALVM